MQEEILEYQDKIYDLYNDYSSHGHGGKYYGLDVIYDTTTQNGTFYNKAHVQTFEKDNSRAEFLLSYDTVVACVERQFGPNNCCAQEQYTVGGKYSVTTGRHVKEFLMQNGLDEDTANKIKHGGVYPETKTKEIELEEER
ncbi:MAG: hypothetical protein LUD48_06230 [Prevotella sp.]|nr:hypothetical protein [Prevotella sp.]